MSLEIVDIKEEKSKNHLSIVEPGIKNTLLAQHMIWAKEIKHFMETESIAVIESFFDHVIKHDITIERKDYFGNFFLRFEGGQVRNSFSKLYDAESLDKEPINQLEDGPCTEDKSEKYKQGTFNEFFANIDAALTQNNIDWKSFKEIIHSINADPSNNKILIPIYIALRKQWYNHNDLTG